MNQSLIPHSAVLTKKQLEVLNCLTRLGKTATDVSNAYRDLTGNVLLPAHTGTVLHRLRDAGFADAYRDSNVRGGSRKWLRWKITPNGEQVLKQ